MSTARTTDEAIPVVRHENNPGEHCARGRLARHDMRNMTLGLLATLSLSLAPLAIQAAEDRSTASAISGHARSFGEAVKRDTQAVGSAVRKGAHRVAVASKAVAHEVATAAKRGAAKTRSALSGDRARTNPT